MSALPDVTCPHCSETISSRHINNSVRERLRELSRDMLKSVKDQGAAARERRLKMRAELADARKAGDPTESGEAYIKAYIKAQQKSIWHAVVQAAISSAVWFIVPWSVLWCAGLEATTAAQVAVLPWFVVSMVLAVFFVLSIVSTQMMKDVFVVRERP